MCNVVDMDLPHGNPVFEDFFGLLGNEQRDVRLDVARRHRVGPGKPCPLDSKRLACQFDTSK